MNTPITQDTPHARRLTGGRTLALGLPTLMLAALLPGVVPGSTAPAGAVTAPVAARTAAQAAVAAPSGPINTASEAAVRNAYNALWGNAAATTIAPTGGSTAGCQSFDTPAAGQQATQNAVNFARGLVGENGVSLQAGYNQAAAQSALMMAASGRLSHSPDSSFSCWTQAGKDAAGRSNILIDGNRTPTAARMTQLYLDDSDASNTAVGHRRWLLRPEATTMGSGNALGSGWFGNSIYVFTFGDDNAAAPARAYYAWPSAGFFPAQLEPAGRWSLSSSGKASFASATVSVQGPGGRVLPVHRYAPENGYADNTLTWDVGGVVSSNSATPTTYTVTVRGITGGPASSYTYFVRLFDPTAPGGDLVLPIDGRGSRIATQTSISVNHTTVRRHHGVRVRVNALAANGRAPRGRLLVYVGHHKVRTIILSAAGRGQRVVRLTFSSRGHKRIHAVFVPRGHYGKSRSTSVRVKVR